MKLLIRTSNTKIRSPTSGADRVNRLPTNARARMIDRISVAASSRLRSSVVVSSPNRGRVPATNPTPTRETSADLLVKRLRPGMVVLGVIVLWRRRNGLPDADSSGGIMPKLCDICNFRGRSAISAGHDSPAQLTDHVPRETGRECATKLTNPAPPAFSLVAHPSDSFRRV